MNMVDVMLGRRWRLSKASRYQHALHFLDGKAQELLIGILKGLAGCVYKWSTVASHAAELGSGRNAEMTRCWLQWQARDIFMESEEANMLKSGGNPYCTATQPTDTLT